MNENQRQRPAVPRPPRTFVLACLLALAAGCASYDGRGLLPGKATLADTLALMGEPSERAATPGGGSVLYFARKPRGRQTYVARFGADGVLLGIEQVLTSENIARLEPGTSDKAAVRTLFGPPWIVSHFPRSDQEVWEYKWLDYQEPRVLWVSFSPDGVVREVTNMHDFEADPPGHYRHQ